MNKQEYRLSPFEHSMYLAQITDPESTEYSLSGYFDIKGAEKKDVEIAFSELIKNHESLHSYYDEINGEPVRILSGEIPSIKWISATTEEEAKKLASDSCKPFSLKTVPLCLTGYTLPDGSIIIHLAIHHIAIDGNSVKILIEELFDRLRGKGKVSIHDLSDRIDNKDNYESGKSYYHEMFPNGVPNNEMPIKCIRPNVHPGVDNKILLHFDESEFASISNSAKTYGVTTFAYLLSAISISLGIYCNSEDIVFGFPVDMRDNDNSDVVGMFVNTAIVRLKPESKKTIKDYLNEVSQIVKTSARGKWLPMSELIRELHVPIDSSRNPIFDVGINYLFLPEECSDGKLKVSFSYDLQSLKRDMNITFHRRGNRLDFILQYASKLFDDDLINWFVEQFQHILSLMKDMNNKVEDVGRLPSSQIEHISRYSVISQSEKILQHIFKGDKAKLFSQEKAKNNLSLYIVNSKNELVPVGVVGELLLSGLTLSKDYIDNNKNSFLDYNGIQVYKTGYYAKWNNDGSVKLLERIDLNNRIRGLRIDFDEIERILETQQGIEKAVVDIKDVGSQKLICAYYVANETLDADKLKSLLKKHLPGYMIPTKYSRITAIPLSADGEKDRKVLPLPDVSLAATIPPIMAENKDSKLVDKVVYHSKLNVALLNDFCSKKEINLNTLFNAAYAYTLAAYAYSEEAIFTTFFVSNKDKTAKSQPVRLSVESETTVDSFITTLYKQLEPFINNSCFTSGEVLNADGIKEGTKFFFNDEELDFNLIDDKTALSVDAYFKDEKVILRGNYKTNAYCKIFIEGFLKCVEQTISELLQKEKLSQISLMYENAFEPYDRENQTDYPVEIVSVNKLFERQVAAHPEKTAVIVAGESLTFDQLNRFANRAAHQLRDLGVGKDSIVGMVLDRTKEIFIAEHAILKAGGAFLPMVPEYPDERIMYCLNNAESPCVITTEAIKASRPELFSDKHNYKTLTVESLIQKGSEENLDLTITPDSLAYCIYTSGSTGNPKGVMIEHKNMCNYLNANPKHPTMYWHTQNIHAALSVTSISFDMSITERFVSLCNGVTVCMATLDEIHNPLALAKLMKANHTESIVCTPSYLMSLLDEPEMHEPIAALKAYHVGGEAFPSTLIARLKELNPNSHVMNGYGPTETSVSCTSSEVFVNKPITIGKPEANVKHYVMDKQLRAVPAGVCGELIICGAGVGRGYVKLPEKTAAAFFTYKGLPAYHSGDLVRLNANGEYDYYGRLDNQVKLRGLRIELDEIETVINEYPGVKLSKVIVCNNGTEDYLAGYYTASKKIPVNELKKFLKTRLTPYMVPDAMRQLDEMPLTVNGKIDKKKLPDIRDEVETREYIAPVGELEEKFCSYFAKVLKQEKVGATDNFFEIGGTSLSAAMVVSKAIHDGFDVVYKNIFDSPTPRQLADFVNKRMKTNSTKKIDKANNTAEIKSTGTEKYSTLLAHNTPKYLSEIKTEKLGTVLLTGATGFLGIHTLIELLRSENVDRILCLVRKKKNAKPNRRLSLLLDYYFNDTFDDLLEKKVEIIDGDITDANLSELLNGKNIDTIINCAALVKHFETGNLIRKVNYEGVLNLIELALEKKARLVQVSTHSIAGSIEADKVETVILREKDYDIGQTLTLKYIISKFEAEGAIFEAIEKRGLRGKIIRIGNLMGRRSDGEFQINFRTNGFMSRLKAYKLLGCFPVNLMDSPVEFSPVDMTAKAVVLLAGTPDSFTVFHANNCHNIHFANVLEAFKDCGYNIDIVDEETFKNRFSEALSDEKKSVAVSSLISYNGNANENLQWTQSDNSYTVKALYRLGFSWPIVSPQYLVSSLQTLDTLGFFDESE